MFRFAVKAGLAAGAVYYLKEEGIWKESDEAIKAYDKLNTTLKPYVNQVREQIPIEIPKISNTERTSYVVQQYWNKAVIATFEFLKNLPSKTSKFTRESIDSIMRNPDVIKIIEATTGDEKPPVDKQ